MIISKCTEASFHALIKHNVPFREIHFKTLQVITKKKKRSEFEVKHNVVFCIQCSFYNVPFCVNQLKWEQGIAVKELSKFYVRRICLFLYKKFFKYIAPVCVNQSK